MNENPHQRLRAHGMNRWQWHGYNLGAWSHTVERRWKKKWTVQFWFVSLQCVPNADTWLSALFMRSEVEPAALWELRQTVWLDLFPAEAITASSQLSLKQSQRCRWHHPLNIWPASWIFRFKIGLAFCQGSLSGDFFFLSLSLASLQHPPKTSRCTQCSMFKVGS